MKKALLGILTPDLITSDDMTKPHPLNLYSFKIFISKSSTLSLKEFISSMFILYLRLHQFLVSTVLISIKGFTVNSGCSSTSQLLSHILQVAKKLTYFGVVSLTPLCKLSSISKVCLGIKESLSPHMRTSTSSQYLLLNSLR